MGVYLKQYAAFWLEQDGLQIGKIARLFNNSSVTSAYPIFEWTKTSKSDKITALIDVAHVASREDTTWSLELKRGYLVPNQITHHDTGNKYSERIRLY